MMAPRGVAIFLPWLVSAFLRRMNPCQGRLGGRARLASMKLSRRINLVLMDEHGLEANRLVELIELIESIELVWQRVLNNKVYRRDCIAQR